MRYTLVVPSKNREVSMHPGAEGDADPPILASTADLLASMTALMGVAEKGIAKVTAPYGLTTLEFDCLGFCLDQDKETTATELASHLPVDASRVSRIVTMLVDKGLLRRRRLRTDRRIVMLRLSSEGRALALQVRRSVNQFVARLVEGISERELQGFVSVASTITANHDAVEQPE